jgi:uncharacterized membrane protein
MNFDVLSVIVYILIAVFLFLMPYLVFPTVPFGVRIPLAYAQDPAVIAERRRYARGVGILAGGLLLADIIDFWSLGRWQPQHQFSIVFLVIGSWVIYYLSHRRLAQVKIEHQWFAGKSQAMAASAAPRSEAPSKLFWVFLALPCAVILLTAVLGAWRYPTLPPTLHFVFPGSLGDWTLAVSPLNAFLPVLFQCLFTLLFAGLAWQRNFGSQPIDVEDPAGSQRYQQINVQIIQVLLLLLALGFDSALLIAGLIGWGLLQASSIYMNIAILAPLAGWLIVAPVLLMGFRANLHAPAGNGDQVNRDDDRFWKLGMVYINRDDPSLLVPKRFGIGRTLNFGHPLSWVIILALIVFILARVLSKT